MKNNELITVNAGGYLGTGKPQPKPQPKKVEEKLLPQLENQPLYQEPFSAPMMDVKPKRIPDKKHDQEVLLPGWLDLDKECCE